MDFRGVGDNVSCWSAGALTQFFPLGCRRTLLANDSCSKKWAIHEVTLFNFELASSGDVVSQTPVSPLYFIR